MLTVFRVRTQTRQVAKGDLPMEVSRTADTSDMITERTLGHHDGRVHVMSSSCQ